ncbi:MAG: hypothetical protein KC646_05420 [Candidatus Cloacimonetes bacterium]|nr:hypothetical protein [Candidatus Cloacimonadota bacterium]
MVINSISLYEVHGDVLAYLKKSSCTSDLFCFFEPDYSIKLLKKFSVSIKSIPIQETHKRVINCHGEPDGLDVPWLVSFNENTLTAFKLLKVKDLPHDIIICDESGAIVFYRFHENSCDYLYSEFDYGILSKCFKSCRLVRNIVATPKVVVNDY